MSEAAEGKGPTAYFPAIEKAYGQPIDHWLSILDWMNGKKHMDMVAALKSEHGMSHGHANALVAHHREQNGAP
jgi:hypothetical protein